MHGQRASSAFVRFFIKKVTDRLAKRTLKIIGRASEKACAWGCDVGGSQKSNRQIQAVPGRHSSALRRQASIRHPDAARC